MQQAWSFLSYTNSCYLPVFFNWRWLFI